MAPLDSVSLVTFGIDKPSSTSKSTRLVEQTKAHFESAE